MNLRNRTARLVAAALFFFVGSLSAEWKVQPTTSAIAFTAYSRIKDADGVFKQWSFDGKIADDWTGTGRIVIQTASIDTQNSTRDSHLKNADFFDVEKFPAAVYKIEKSELKDDRLQLTGSLTMHGVTKPLVINLKRTVSGSDAELSGETMVKRSDYGLNYGLTSMINPIKDEVKLVFKVALKKG